MLRPAKLVYVRTEASLSHLTANTCVPSVVKVMQSTQYNQEISPLSEGGR